MSDARVRTPTNPGALRPILVFGGSREAVALRVAALAEAAGFIARVLPLSALGKTAEIALRIVDLGDADSSEQVLGSLAGLVDSDVPLLVLAPEDEELLRRAIAAGADDFVREAFLGRDLPLRLAVQRRAWEARREVERRERDLLTLVELTRSLAGDLDSTSLLSEVTERLASELGLRRCSIVLIDDRGERGTIVASSDDVGPAGPRKRLELAKYPEIQEAIRTRRPVIVQDAEHHPLLDPVKEAIRDAGLGALAVLPLVLEERVLGVLFLRAGVRAGFSPREIGFAATVANATAVALRNARSFDEIRGRSEEAERRVAELARFQDVFEHVSDGIALIANADGTLQLMNPAACAILGVSPAELHGHRLKEFVQAVDLSAFRSLVGRVKAGEVLRQTDLTMQRRDGVVVELSIGAARLEEAGLLVLTFRDVTERRRVQAELQRSNEFLEKLIESSVDGIVAADMRGKIVLFNKGAEELLGYTAAQAIAALHVSGLYPDDGAREVMNLLRADAHGGPGRLTAHRRYVQSRTGQKIPVQMTAAIMRDGDKELGSVGIFSDLRERLRTEEELVTAQERLQQGERAALVAELAGTAAHELNQPLTSVMGYSELLKRRLKPEDPLFRAVDIIYREAERMAEIVRKIGKITRYETKAYVGSARIVDLERASGGEEER